MDSDQALGYKRCELRINDYTLDAAQLETRCPLDSGRHTAPSHLSTRHPAASTGRLDRLPLELLSSILLVLDVSTLTEFRHVNRRATDLVDSLHQYQAVRRHCPNILRAIVSIRASSFTCRDLYESLLATKCATCDRFGGYLYIITCRRVCYFCFIRHTDYFPLLGQQAAQMTGLSRKDLIGTLPHVRSLPGRYTAFAKLSRPRLVLLDRRAVVSLGRADDAGEHQQQQRPDYTTREVWRYMSIISAPCFTDAGQRADWGRHCSRCKDSTDEPANHLRNLYTSDGLVEHYRQHHATER
ncbi:hypothetical protein N658DRAFT_497281 [Parathielavia hyrcaniae]|uniref:F-box domain-containing protein n=1 Tax=Parathielavia hyrcaniae TaxID=113614 RepID=A0AAN6T1F1_9PEZI|nr:hypothetical protein N658DRAFT_497281 [Parathielavia hyrcaniae]